MNLATRILSNITRTALYLAIFLIPLFFLPSFILDNQELNKYFLFYLLVLLSFICYLTRIIASKTIVIKRSPLDIPILVLWFVFLIITLVSQERYLSFFGDFSSPGISFVGLSMWLIFYFLITQNFNEIKQVTKALSLLFISGSLAGIYFILRAAPLFKGLIVWPNWFQRPEYNLMNGSNTLFGVFLAVIFILTLSCLTIRRKKLGMDILSLMTFLIAGAALVMIGFKVVWVIVAVSLFLMLVFFLTYLEEARTVWISVTFAILVISLLFILLNIPRFLTVDLPLEVSLGAGVSWNIAIDTLTDNARNFLFGSGPATFIYDFSYFRPEIFNNNFAWNIRFRQPFSVALEWLTTTGLLGSLAFFFTILMVLGLVITVWLKQLLEIRRKKKPAEESASKDKTLSSSPLLFWGLMAGWLTLLISFFAVNLCLVHWLLFWLFLGLMVAAGTHLSRAATPSLTISLKTSPQYALVTSFGFILIFTAIIVLGIYLGRFLVGEVVYVRALNKPMDEKIVYLQRAANLNPNRVLFQLSLAEAFLNKAVDVANRTKDMNAVSSLMSSAVGAARTATDKSPLNVASWEFLAAIYANARPIAPEANNWTIGALEKAISLEPTNPTFYVALGNAKFLEKRYSEAKDDFEKAISLKPNLLVAYSRLALLQEEQKNINGAIATLEKGLTYGQQDAAFVFQLGRYYFNRGQKDDWGLAEMAFRRAIAINPNYSDALYALAALYERTGHKAEALNLYRRVLALNPENKDIKKRVDSLSGSSE